MILRPLLQPILQPVLRPWYEARRRSAFSWDQIFDGTPGFRISVEEALRLNQQALGPELFSGDHSGFSAQTGISASASEVTFTAVPPSTYTTLNLGLQQSKPYVIRWRVVSHTAGGVRLAVNAGVYSATQSSVGVFSTLLTTTGASGNIAIGSHTATFTGAVRIESVREIDLSKCVAFQDSAGTLPVVGVEQPIGYIKDMSGNGNHFIQPSNTASRPIVSRRVNLLTATETLATQNVTTLAASHVLTFTGPGSVTLSGTATGTYSAGTHTITTTAGTLTVTVSGSVTNADLRLSIDAALPSYQRVTSSTDYDEVGFPAFALFDGLDDWLESGVVDMSSTDEVTVIAGVTKFRDAATAIAFEFSQNTTSTAGSFAIAAPSEHGANSYRALSRGTVLTWTGTGVFSPAPDRSLVALVGKISAPFVTLRRNGVQVEKSTSNQGSGNYTAQKFYMGRRAGTSLPFNGRIYGVTVIGKLLTDSQLARAEQAERQLGRLY